MANTKNQPSGLTEASEKPPALKHYLVTVLVTEAI
jgi:hypothetical protein